MKWLEFEITFYFWISFKKLNEILKCEPEPKVKIKVVIRPKIDLWNLVREIQVDQMRCVHEVNLS